jgi:Arc/MetJ-type ribon-helix-helix transcriptional regulator
MGEKLLSVRVPESLLERMDELAGAEGRSKWVRSVLERACGSEVQTETRPKVKPAAEKVVAKRVPAQPERRGDADAEALLEHIRGAPRVVRKLADEMGWMPLRADRVLARLGGSVRFEGGMVVASEE